MFTFYFSEFKIFIYDINNNAEVHELIKNGFFEVPMKRQKRSTVKAKRQNYLDIFHLSDEPCNQSSVDMYTYYVTYYGSSK